MRVISLSGRKKGLTAVTLDDDSEMLIDTEIVIAENIKVGTEISDTEELLYKSDFKRAKSRALWYLSRADHSKKALTEKLINGGFCEEAARSAVERMQELGLVDDRSLALRLAEYYNASGISKREIVYKLRSKGIPKELALEVTADDESDEVKKIKALLNRKYLNKLSTEDGVRKTFAALQRKGFSYSDIKQALKNYSEELENSEDSYGI